MGELRIAIEIVESIIANCRSVVRLAKVNDFQDFLKAESEEKQAEVVQWIKAGNLTELKKWYASQKQDCLESMSIRSLRSLAKHYQVAQYCKLNKRKLIILLKGFVEK